MACTTRCRPVGAHEVIVENARHDRHLWNADDREIEEYLALCGQRIQDLKRHSLQIRHVFKNFGSISGQQWDHPTTEIVATTFVPRRVLYELRAAREHYQLKERCVFCDILGQEQEQKLRLIEVRGDYMASCPYAPRVPYETWIAPRIHEAYFERSATSPGRCATLPPCCGAPCTVSAPSPTASTWCCTLRPIPCTARRRSVSGRPLDDDYHWHLEILPILGTKAKSLHLQRGVLLAGKLGDCGSYSARAAYGVRPTESQPSTRSQP